ncbi:C6 zinc finger [Aspergillus sclerotialis]|uniref:C6 zinc finger n=1 Tax=Aspergillus sclerotialis TaxID=2070753 RepID=A0A3A3A7C5_9EURO|nr:C6 zinc finger [Aspergillus sclerotialis]
MSHSGGPTWSLLGTTLHIAIGIGCSVDPDHLNVGIIEAEERRRCWAALTMLYIIQNICFGNTMPFRIQADVALPADIDDEDLTDTRRGSVPSSSGQLTQMSYLLCKFRLYNLAFDICRLSSSKPLQSRQSTMKLDHKLGEELKRHMSLFDNATDMPFYHVAHFYIVNNYTHHLYLLLHRPFLGAVESDPSTERRTQIRESSQRCTKSAMKILSNFESFHHNPNLKPYNWYIYGFGSFQALLAITTLGEYGQGRHRSYCKSRNANDH